MNARAHPRGLAPIGRAYGPRAWFDAWRAGRARAALPEERESEDPEEPIESERAPEVMARRALLVAAVLLAAVLLYRIGSELFGAMLVQGSAAELPTRPTLRSTVAPLVLERDEPEPEPVEPAPAPAPAPEPMPTWVPPPPPPPAPIMHGTRSAVVADAGEWLLADASMSGATMVDAAPALYGSGGVFDDAATREPPPVPSEGTIGMEEAATTSVAEPAGVTYGAPDAAPDAGYLAPDHVEIGRLRARPSPVGGHLTIGAGRLIECSTDRLVVTTLPGTIRCELPRDVYGDSGEVILMPRGMAVLGTYATSLRNGGRRLDVIWSLGRTDGPDGIEIPFDSHSAGPEGAAGAPARVDTHFRERFAAAMLVSIIDEAIGAAARAQGGDSTVAIDGAARSGARVVEAIIDESIGIDATGTIPQGTRLMIDVRHDLDFSDVYSLEPIATGDAW